jgi:hypothetical protein
MRRRPDVLSESSYGPGMPRSLASLAIFEVALVGTLRLMDLARYGANGLGCRTGLGSTRERTVALVRCASQGVRWLEGYDCCVVMTFCLDLPDR